MSKVYQIVQERIIKDIEDAIKNGTSAPWVKPWTSNNAPKNFITKIPYKGVNKLLLKKGGYYITMKQIKDLQKKHPFIKLKKGSKSEMVVYWLFSKEVEVKSEDELKDDEVLKEKKYVSCRYYNVFHQSDVEGLEQLIPEEEKVEYIHTTNNEKAESIISLYSDIVPIHHQDIDRAFYTPALDEIVVPSATCFENIEEFYSTNFHEIIHSTGHSSRLDRLEKNFKFGDHNYSKEELVAEIGASMLCVECNIDSKEVIQNSNAYLYGWLSQIKKDVSLIISASQRAEKACEYVLDNTINIVKEEKIEKAS